MNMLTVYERVMNMLTVYERVMNMLTVYERVMNMLTVYERVMNMLTVYSMNVLSHVCFHVQFFSSPCSSGDFDLDCLDNVSSTDFFCVFTSCLILK